MRCSTSVGSSRARILSKGAAGGWDGREDAVASLGAWSAVPGPSPANRPPYGYVTLSPRQSGMPLPRKHEGASRLDHSRPHPQNSALVGGPHLAESPPPSRHRTPGRLTPTPTRTQGRAHSMGVEAQIPPLTGKMLGRYRIVSRLAVGGMAELWLALASTAKGETQKVVLKTMLPNVAESREFVRMFQTEASIGSRLR